MSHFIANHRMMIGFLIGVAVTAPSAYWLGVLHMFITFKSKEKSNGSHDQPR
jgi:hypothetical protein